MNRPQHSTTTWVLRPDTVHDADHRSPVQPLVSPLTPPWGKPGANGTEHHSSDICDASQCHQCPLFPGEIHHICPKFIQAILNALSIPSVERPVLTQVARQLSQTHGPAQVSEQPRTQARPARQRRTGRNTTVPPRTIVTRAVTRARAAALARGPEAAAAAAAAAAAPAPASTSGPFVQTAELSPETILPDERGEADSSPAGRVEVQRTHSKPDKFKTPRKQMISSPHSGVLTAARRQIATQGITVPQRPIRQPRGPGFGRGQWGATPRGSPHQRGSGSESVDVDREGTRAILPNLDNASPMVSVTQAYWQRDADALTPATRNDVFNISQPPRKRRRRDLDFGITGDTIDAHNRFYASRTYNFPSGHLIPRHPLSSTATTAEQPRSLLAEFNARRDSAERDMSPQHSISDSLEPVNRQLDFTRREDTEQ